MIVGAWVLSFQHFTPAACEFISTSWKLTHPEEKKWHRSVGDGINCAGVFDCFVFVFEPSLAFGLLEQEQWKPTTETAIKLTRMGMMMIMAHWIQRKKNRGLWNKMGRMNKKINGMIICLSPHCVR